MMMWKKKKSQHFCLKAITFTWVLNMLWSPCDSTISACLQEVNHCFLAVLYISRPGYYCHLFLQGLQFIMLTEVADLIFWAMSLWALPLEQTFPSETLALVRPCHPTWRLTGLTWGCHIATTQSVWAQMLTQRRMASCRRSTRSDYGAAATPSQAAAPACPAGPTPIWPSPTLNTRTQKTVRPHFSLCPWFPLARLLC